jgi:hypothetical protein
LTPASAWFGSGDSKVAFPIAEITLCDLQTVINLDILKRQRETESPMDGVVADTWEKLGPAPEVDYGKL